MRLQTEGAPNPADRHAAEPGGLGQAARAPMRLGARCTFQGLNHNLLDLSIADFAGRSGSRLVIESFQATPQKSGAPLGYMPSEQRSFFAALLFASPWAQASTTRARRASAGWLRARWASDCSRSCSSSVKVKGRLGRPVR